MSDETAKHYSVAEDLPCGMRFTQKNPAEGWGRISKISQDSVELKTHFTLVPQERVYLTFGIEEFFKFDDVPAKVSGVSPGGEFASAEIILDEGPHRDRLKAALVDLLNRA